MGTFLDLMTTLAASCKTADDWRDAFSHAVSVAEECRANAVILEDVVHDMCDAEVESGIATEVLTRYRSYMLSDETHRNLRAFYIACGLDTEEE